MMYLHGFLRLALQQWPSKSLTLENFREKQHKDVSKKKKKSWCLHQVLLPKHVLFT